MAKSESFFVRLNHFIYNHLLLIIILLLVGWWLYQQNPRPFSGMGGMTQDASFSEEMASPKMMYSRGGADFATSSFMPPMMENNFVPNAEDRKIVKNASLDLEVADTEGARSQAETIITDAGGAVTNLNSWEVRPNVLAYNLTTRVPSEKLEDTILALTALGVKKSENFNTTDITAQYEDTENRLDNLRSRRDSLRAMMERDTSNLADILAVDRELANVQSEIEMLERTQSSRTTDVAYSTLTLSLNPETQIGDVSNPHWNVTKSWRTAINDFIMSSQGLTDKLIKVVVYIPIWLPILLILWWADRKFLKRR